MRTPPQVAAIARGAVEGGLALEVLAHVVQATPAQHGRTPFHRPSA